MVDFARLLKRGKPEKPKAHDEIPEGLGIGIFEERNPSGELVIFLKGSRLESGSAWVVLGQYANPDKDGNVFYVADRTSTHWSDVAVTTKHEHLLLAVARIHQIKDQYHGVQDLDDNIHGGLQRPAEA